MSRTVQPLHRVGRAQTSSLALLRNSSMRAASASRRSWGSVPSSSAVAVSIAGSSRATVRPVGPSETMSRRVRLDVSQQFLDAVAYLVAYGADVEERQSCGIGDGPVEVAGARDVGAGVAAAHGDDDVGIGE